MPMLMVKKNDKLLIVNFILILIECLNEKFVARRMKNATPDHRTLVAKCINFDGGNFKHLLCTVTNLSFKHSVTIKIKLSVSNLTLRLLMSYIYGAPSKARNANVVYIWTYVWQR